MGEGLGLQKVQTPPYLSSTHITAIRGVDQSRHLYTTLRIGHDAEKVRLIGAGSAIISGAFACGRKIMLAGAMPRPWGC